MSKTTTKKQPRQPKRQTKKLVTKYMSQEESHLLSETYTVLKHMYESRGHNIIATPCTEEKEEGYDYTPENPVCVEGADRIFLRNNLKRSFKKFLKKNRTSVVPPYRTFQIGSTWNQSKNAVVDRFLSHAATVHPSDEFSFWRMQVTLRDMMMDISDIILNHCGCDKFIICISHPALLTAVDSAEGETPEFQAAFKALRDSLPFHNGKVLEAMCDKYNENEKLKDTDQYVPPSVLDQHIYAISSRIIWFMSIVPIAIRHRIVFAPLLEIPDPNANGLFFSVYVGSEKSIASASSYAIECLPGKQKVANVVEIQTDVYQIAQLANSKGRLKQGPSLKHQTVIVYPKDKIDSQNDIIAALAITDGVRYFTDTEQLDASAEIITGKRELSKLKKHRNIFCSVEISEKDYTLIQDGQEDRVFTSIKDIIETISDGLLAKQTETPPPADIEAES